MSDSIPELCTRILQAVGNPATVSVPQIVELLASYNDAVDGVNARLRRAVVWLRAGLRAEAIGYVEQFPDALEMARALELGESWIRWADMVAQADAGEVRGIDTEIACEINESFDAHRAMDAALREYRRVALLCLSVDQHIRAIRTLERLDPANPIWQEQRRAAEEILLTMHNREAKAAQQRGDIGAVRAILEDLTRRDWVVKPPAAFVKALNQIERQIAERQARSTFQDLATELHLAFGAFDEDAVDRLLDRWSAVESDLKVEAPIELKEDIASILAWREQRRAECAQAAGIEGLLERLSRELDEDAPAVQLERTHAALLRQEAAIPQVLQSRYGARMETLRGVSQRRGRLILAGVAMVVVILVSGAVYAVIQTQRAHEIDRFVSSVSADLDPKDLDIDAAELQFTSVGAEREWLLRAPEVVALRAKLEAEKRERTERMEAFQVAFRRLKGMSFDEPEAWQVLDRVDGLCAPADRRALQAERDRLEGDLAEHIRQRAAAHIEARAALLAQEQQVRQQAAQLAFLDAQRLLADGLEPMDRALADLIRSDASPGVADSSEEVARRTRDAMAEVIENSRAALNSIQSTRSQARVAVVREERRQKALKSIRLTPRGMIDRLATELAGYIEEFPVTTTDEFGQAAAWFREALQGEPAWRAAREWNQLIDMVGGSKAAVSTAKEADNRLQRINALLERLPGNATDLADYRAYLQRASASLSEEGQCALASAHMRQALSVPAFRSMTWVPAMIVGEHYYSFAPEGTVLARVHVGRDQVSIPAFVQNLNDVQAGAGSSFPVTVFIRSGADPVLRAAGHVTASREIIAALDEFERGPSANWDRLYLDVARLVERWDMDDIVRVQLVTRLLEEQARVGWFPIPRLDELRTGVQELLEAQWPQCDARTLVGKEAMEARARARELLASVAPRLDTIASEMIQRFQGMCPSGRYAHGGMVWVNDEGRRCIVGSDALDGLHVLSIVDGRLIAEAVHADSQGTIEGTPSPPPGTPLFRISKQ